MAGQTHGVGADTGEQAMAGVRSHPDAPAAELGHALRPGAIALVVFVDPARVPVVRMGLQDIGAQVLSDDDLPRRGHLVRHPAHVPARDEVVRATWRRPADRNVG